MEGHNRKSCLKKSNRDTTESVASSSQQKRHEAVKRKGKEKTQATSQREGRRPTAIYGPMRISQGAHTGDVVIREKWHIVHHCPVKSLNSQHSRA
ncbi:hypothetical protein DsansV1_C06g0063361 [Dioscorea sansibarensis]